MKIDLPVSKKVRRTREYATACFSIRAITNPAFGIDPTSESDDSFGESKRAREGTREPRSDKGHRQFPAAISPGGYLTNFPNPFDFLKFNFGKKISF